MVFTCYSMPRFVRLYNIFYGIFVLFSNIIYSYFVRFSNITILTKNMGRVRRTHNFYFAQQKSRPFLLFSTCFSPNGFLVLKFPSTLISLVSVALLRGRLLPWLLHPLRSGTAAGTARTTSFGLPLLPRSR